MLLFISNLYVYSRYCHCLILNYNQVLKSKLKLDAFTFSYNKSKGVERETYASFNQCLCTFSGITLLQLSITVYIFYFSIDHNAKRKKTE